MQGGYDAAKRAPAKKSETCETILDGKATHAGTEIESKLQYLNSSQTVAVDQSHPQIFAPERHDAPQTNSFADADPKTPQTHERQEANLAIVNDNTQERFYDLRSNSDHSDVEAGIQAQRSISVCLALATAVPGKPVVEGIPL